MDYVPISALQHYTYCPRQCYLIYLEDIYEENIYTLEGSSIHEKVHEEISQKRKQLRIETSLPIWSSKLRIRGQADLVEFKEDDIRPVEYKRGKKKSRRADEIQLCAQALCLEEMFKTHIEEGDIYHHSSHQRRQVKLGTKLRSKVKETIKAVQELLEGQIVPPPATDDRCYRCSLKHSCMPKAIANKAKLKIYQRDLFKGSIT